MPAGATAASMALAGCACRVASGPATTPWAPTSASQVSPSSSAFDFFMTTTAAAPSEICDAEPAVIVPSLPNAGFRFGILDGSDLVGCSSRSTVTTPLRVFTSTGTISASKPPDSCAALARPALAVA